MTLPNIQASNLSPTKYTTDSLRSLDKTEVHKIANCDHVMACLDKTQRGTNQRTKIALCAYIREKIRHYRATHEEFTPLSQFSNVELSKEKLQLLNSDLISDITPKCKARLKATQQATFEMEPSTSRLAESILSKYNNLHRQRVQEQDHEETPPPSYEEVVNGSNGSSL